MNGSDPRGLWPDWLEPLIFGTFVHSFLGAKFKSAATVQNMRWANQQVRTIVKSLTGKTLKNKNPYNLKPDLVEASIMKSIGSLYEIKKGSFASFADPSKFDAATAIAVAQLVGYEALLNGNIPNFTWSRGNHFLPGVHVHEDFASFLLPEGMVLVTFSDYLRQPGVLLYDLVDKSTGDQIRRWIRTGLATTIGLDVVLRIIAQNHAVQTTLTRSVSLATTAKSADAARFSLVASLSGVGVGIAIGGFSASSL